MIDVGIANNEIAIRAAPQETIFPNNVFGTVSPYPTVVTVDHRLL